MWLHVNVGQNLDCRLMFTPSSKSHNARAFFGNDRYLIEKHPATWNELFITKYENRRGRHIPDCRRHHYGHWIWSSIWVKDQIFGHLLSTIVAHELVYNAVCQGIRIFPCARWRCPQVLRGDRGQVRILKDLSMHIPTCLRQLEQRKSIDTHSKRISGPPRLSAGLNFTLISSMPARGGSHIELSYPCRLPFNSLAI